MKLSEKIDAIAMAFHDSRRIDVVRSIADEARLLEQELERRCDGAAFPDTTLSVPDVRIVNPHHKEDVDPAEQARRWGPGRIEVMQDDLRPRLRVLVKGLRHLADHNKGLSENNQQPYYLGFAHGLEQAARDICEIMGTEENAAPARPAEPKPSVYEKALLDRIQALERDNAHARRFIESLRPGFGDGNVPELAEAAWVRRAKAAERDSD